jgi:hypothetical protein
VHLSAGVDGVLSSVPELKTLPEWIVQAGAGRNLHNLEGPGEKKECTIFYLSFFQFLCTSL